MKRYLKLVITAGIIMGTLLTFYLKSDASILKEVKVKLTHLSGEAETVDNLTIHGAIEAREDQFSNFETIWTNFIIENEQGKPRLKTGTELISRYFSPERMVEKSLLSLREDYRNFMRGKELIPQNYYEDDERVIYAELNNNYNVFGTDRNEREYEVFIDMLMKDTKKRQKAKVILPQTKDTFGVTIEDVQWENGKVHLMTNQPEEFRHGEDYTYQEVFISHLIDLERQEVSDRIELFTREYGDDDRTSTNVIKQADPLGSNPYALILSELHREEQNEAVDEEFLLVNREVFLTDLETGESKELKLPKEIGLTAESLVMHQEFAYFYDEQAEPFAVLKWNVLTNEVEKIIIEQVEMKNGNNSLFFETVDEKLILLHRQIEAGEKANVVMLDLTTSKVDYIGELEVKYPINNGYIITFYWLNMK